MKDNASLSEKKEGAVKDSEIRRCMNSKLHFNSLAFTANTVRFRDDCPLKNANIALS